MKLLIHAGIKYLTHFSWADPPDPGGLYQFNKQSGTKPNLVAKILATNFGVFFVIYIMFSKISSVWGL